MTEAQSILVVFGVLYLSECVLWLPADSVCFAGMARRLRPAWRPAVLGNTKMQLFLFSLWPGARTVVALPSRIVPGTETLALQSQTRGWLTVDYPSAADISRNGTRLSFGGRTVDLRSVSMARTVQRWLIRLSSVPEAGRAGIIDGIVRRSCDPERAKRVMELTDDRLYMCRQLAGLLLLWTFVAGPLLYMLSDRSLGFLLRFGAVYLALWWGCAFAGFVRHRRLLPELRRERWSSLLLSMISPPHAIRQSDQIVVPLGRDVHPLAYAMDSVNDESVLASARSSLAELRYPQFPYPEQQPHDTCDAAESIVRDFRGKLADELIRELCASRFDEAQLCQPEEQHPEAVCWCPRCFNQFTEEKESCEDCPGVVPLPF